MAQPKRYARIQGIVPWELAHDVWLLVEGKVTDWNMVPVRHGGESESGELRARPPAREVVLAFAQTRKQWTTKDLQAEVRDLGYTAGALYQGIKVLRETKTLKRVAPMTYALTAKTAKPSNRGKWKREAKGGTIRSRVLAYVREKQNGTGEGVAVTDMVNDLKIERSVVSNALSQFVTAKTMTRVGPGMYRARGEV